MFPQHALVAPSSKLMPCNKQLDTPEGSACLLLHCSQHHERGLACQVPVLAAAAASSGITKHMLSSCLLFEHMMILFFCFALCAGMQVLCMQDCALLWLCMPEGSLEDSQTSMQGVDGSCSSLRK